MKNHLSIFITWSTTPVKIKHLSLSQFDIIGFNGTGGKNPTGLWTELSSSQLNSVTSSIIYWYLIFNEHIIFVIFQVLIWNCWITTVPKPSLSWCHYIFISYFWAYAWWLICQKIWDFSWYSKNMLIFPLAKATFWSVHYKLCKYYLHVSNFNKIVQASLQWHTKRVRMTLDSHCYLFHLPVSIKHLHIAENTS